MTSDEHTGCPGPGALHEIVGGIWAWVQPDGSWWLNNAGAISGVGDDGTHPAGTFVVDTCATFERTSAFLDAVAAATGGAAISSPGAFGAVGAERHRCHCAGRASCEADHWDD